MGVVMVMSSWGWVVTTVAAELHAGCRMPFPLSRVLGKLLRQCISTHVARFASGRVMAVAVVCLRAVDYHIEGPHQLPQKKDEVLSVLDQVR